MNFERFMAKVLDYWELLHPLKSRCKEIVLNFKKYKSSIPSCGAVMVNHALNKVVIVSSFDSKSGWSFPMGKRNRDETNLQCAIREVFEETSFDLSGLAQEDLFVEKQLKDKQICLFIVRNVPEDFEFECRTRFEIESIEWRSLASLDKTFKSNSKEFFMVNRFLPDIRKALQRLKKNRTKGAAASASRSPKRAVASSPAETDTAAASLQPVEEPHTAGLFAQPTAWQDFQFDAEAVVAVAVGAQA